jgi:hypothetical protein
MDKHYAGLENDDSVGAGSIFFAFAIIVTFVLSFIHGKMEHNKLINVARRMYSKISHLTPLLKQSYRTYEDAITKLPSLVKALSSIDAKAVTFTIKDKPKQLSFSNYLENISNNVALYLKTEGPYSKDKQISDHTMDQSATILLDFLDLIHGEWNEEKKESIVAKLNNKLKTLDNGYIQFRMIDKTINKCTIGFYVDTKLNKQEMVKLSKETDNVVEQVEHEKFDVDTVINAVKKIIKLLIPKWKGKNKFDSIRLFDNEHNEHYDECMESYKKFLEGKSKNFYICFCDSKDQEITVEMLPKFVDAISKEFEKTPYSRSYDIRVGGDGDEGYVSLVKK